MDCCRRIVFGFTVTMTVTFLVVSLYYMVHLDHRLSLFNSNANFTEYSQDMNQTTHGFGNDTEENLISEKENTTKSDSPQDMVAYILIICMITSGMGSLVGAIACCCILWAYEKYDVGGRVQRARVRSARIYRDCMDRINRNPQAHDISIQSILNLSQGETAAISVVHRRIPREDDAVQETSADLPGVPSTSDN